MRLQWLSICLATFSICTDAKHGPLLYEPARPPSPFSYRDQEQLLPLVHDTRRELLHLHRKLVQIESITGNELEVGTWLASYLESHNLTVEKLEIAPNRFNVFAYPGTANKTKVLVSSHIDTVRLRPSLLSSQLPTYLMLSLSNTMRLTVPSPSRFPPSSPTRSATTTPRSGAVAPLTPKPASPRKPLPHSTFSRKPPKPARKRRSHYHHWACSSSSARRRPATG